LLGRTIHPAFSVSPQFSLFLALNCPLCWLQFDSLTGRAETSTQGSMCSKAESRNGPCRRFQAEQALQKIQCRNIHTASIKIDLSRE
jgi:hypothetical protein